MKISSFVVLMLMLALGLEAGAQTPAQPAKNLSLDQKIGQLMIWSFPGKELTPWLESHLTKYQPGSLIFFRRNITDNHQVIQLTSALQRLAKRNQLSPFLLMIDQEGGVVTRVRMNTPLPSALALGRVDDRGFIESFARTKAELLLSLGFHVNLAPVLDVSNPTKDSFIGNRTFGADPSVVTDLSMAYSKGLSLGGVLPTAKHFPGHGGTIQDSHKTTPKKLVTEEELVERDLVPFQAFADARFPRAIMMAHLALPNIDESSMPATFSAPIIQDKLRTEMGFKGLVMTDDLEMAGAAVGDIGERAVKAFLAGNDQLMFAGTVRNQRRAFEAIKAAVNDGRISLERLDESVNRIMEAKSQLKLNATRVDERKANSAVRRLEKLSREVMQRNFKFALESRAKEWPKISRSTSTVVFSSSPGFHYRFSRTFRGHSRFYKLAPETLDGVTTELADERVPFAIFYASGNKTARWLSTLSPELKSKLIVVNCNHDGEVEDQESFLSVLNLGSPSPESGEWLARALSAPPTPAPITDPAPEIRTPASEIPEGE